MHPIRTVLCAVLATAALSTTAAAQAKVKHAPEEKVTASMARVKKADATKTALAAVPGGKVASVELEKEDGKLIYSFDITSKGKTGVDEVQVDAITGVVVSNKHETPAMEKAEKKAEAKEKKKP